jgi:hypothetical protein
MILKIADFKVCPGLSILLPNYPGWIHRERKLQKKLVNNGEFPNENINS